MEEIWKDIPNYEGLYQVSNLGEVKSLNYNHQKKSKLLKQKEQKTGYKNVTLCKKGRKKIFLVHRLVAKCFLDNYDDKLQVNHIDGNKKNNKLSNIEMVTASENQKHSYKNNLHKISGNAIIGRKKVKCIELQIEKDSIREMFKFLLNNNYLVKDNRKGLTNAINNNKKFVGLTFEYVNDKEIKNAKKC